MNEIERMAGHVSALTAQVTLLNRSISDMGAKLDKVHKRIFEENGEPSLIAGVREQRTRLATLEDELRSLRLSARAGRTRLQQVGWKLLEVAAIGAMLWVLTMVWEGVTRRLQPGVQETHARPASLH